MSKLHEYPVAISWKGGRDGSGTAKSERSGVAYPLSTPPEFGGPGEGTNPEELLTSAIAACYSITFGIIASNRKLPVENLSVHAVGEVEESGPSFTYRKITVAATITLAADASEDQVKMALDMAHKADAYCIVTNAIRGKVEIVLEPTVSKG